jgi:uncharacterized protein (TIGR04222 family)
MNTVQAELYQRLQNFELDDPSHEFGFTRHLIKGQGWSLAYAQQAIAEYKKFVFLAMVADHQVVPPDAVDQVWHAHILLTQSYWEGFCQRVLGKPLHHHPARGGKAERAEFHQLYMQTIELYCQFFGSPPIGIWSPPDRRFGVELKMQRINLAEHWVIPKQLPRWRVPRWAILPVMLVGLGFIPAGCVGLSRPQITATQLFDASAGLILLGVFLAIKLWRYCLRLPQSLGQPPHLDNYEIAYLCDGASRATELALVQLVDQGYLRPNVQTCSLGIAQSLPASAPYLQQQVMQQVQKTPQLKDLQPAIQSKAWFLAEQLRQKKLLLRGWRAQLSASIGYFMLANLLGALGLALITGLTSVMGIPDVLSSIFLRPEVAAVLGYFGWVWMAVGLICLCSWIPSDRTHWGNQMRAEIRQGYDAHNLAQAVAVKGIAAASGGALDDLKQMFQNVAADAASSSCGCGC